MPGFGLAAYGLGPLGIPAADLPAEDPCKVSSSRQVDGKTGRFVQTTNGGYAGMGDTQQRVLFLVSAATRSLPPHITDENMSATRQAIITALAPLTDPKNQTIELLDVAVTDNGRNLTQTLVRFRDVTSGGIHTVQPR
jgi:hypothetical protein